MQKRRPFDFPPSLGALALFGLVVVAYAPLWHAGFIWGDDSAITANPSVQGGLEGLAQLWRGRGTDYTPLTQTLFWGEWHAFDGSSIGFHLANFLLHTVGAVLIWRVLLRLRVEGAWLAAALFAVQPVNLASAAWISQERNTLSLIFAALAVLGYLRWREARTAVGYGLALLAFGAALLSKATVAPVPLVLLTALWWTRGDAFNLKRDGLPLLPWLLMSAAAGGLAHWFELHRVIGTDVVHPEGLMARFCGAGQAAWYYAWTEICPYDLYIIAPRWDLHPSNPSAWLGIAAWAGVLAALYAARGRLGRGPFALALCWWLFLSPVLGFFDIYYMRYALVADHWQYLASIVGMTAVAIAIMRVPVRFVPPLGMTAVCALTALTNLQSSTYNDAESYWRTAVARNPSSYVAWLNLGRAVVNKPVDEDETEEDYRKAIALRPDDAMAHNLLAITLRQKNKIDEAILHYQAAVDLKPDFANAHYNLGVALNLVGRSDEAVMHFQRAVELEPDNMKSRLNLISALIDAERYPEALAAADAALRMDAGDPAFLFNRGLALEHEGKLTDALADYQETLRGTPGFMPAMTRLAWIRATAPDAKLRDGQEAIKLASTVCDSTENKDFGSLDALGAAYAEIGKFGDAVNMAERALPLAPPSQRAAIEKRIARYNALQPYRSAATR